jgi:diguanylate cyclase (GGDEF)-like protein
MQQVSLDRDPLVDLFNRRYVLDELEHHVRRHRRHHRPFSLLIVDIHNIAQLDRTVGSAVTDAIVGDLADLISANVREVDVWFLCTRDQFIVVMDETDSQAAQTVADRLEAETDKTRSLRDPATPALEMTFSTACCPEDAVDPEGLLRVARFQVDKAV